MVDAIFYKNINIIKELVIGIYLDEEGGTLEYKINYENLLIYGNICRQFDNFFRDYLKKKKEIKMMRRHGD